MGLSWLQPNDPFPSPWSDADPDPEVPGLLAISEDISAEQLLRAYLDETTDLLKEESCIQKDIHIPGGVILKDHPCFLLNDKINIKLWLYISFKLDRECLISILSPAYFRP